MSSNRNETQREITGIVLFFCSVALMLIYYLPEEITGVVGALIKNIGFGFIGSAAIMIPVFLFYAAIDFFMEKKEGVAPVRVRSVVMIIICVASLLAVCTMDFDYFAKICIDPMTQKAKATAAIALLWESGKDSSLILNPAVGGHILPGGLIGGGIAVAFNAIAGKTISILGILVYTICQILIIWRVSLKRAARYTVDKSREVINRRRQQTARPRPQQVYSPNRNSQQAQIQNGNPQGINCVQPITPVAPQNTSRRIGNTQYVSNSPYVNVGPTQVDPLNPKMPVDPKTGFQDVSAMGLGVQQSDPQGAILYENKPVAGSENTGTADYSFTTKPLNPYLRNTAQETKRPSFLEQPKKQDFMDMSGLGESSFAPDPREAKPAPKTDAFGGTQQYNHNTQYNEGPYEIVDDDEYESFGLGEPTIRHSYVDMSRIQAESHDYYSASNQHVDNGPTLITAPIAEIVEPEEIEEETKPASNATINALNTDSDSYSATEGRIIDTSSKAEPVVDVPSSADAQTHRVFSKRNVVYRPAPINLLAPEPAKVNTKDDESLKQKALELEETLKTFGIAAEVKNITHGPAITRFELQLTAKGVKVSKINSLQDDIALAMAAISVRIEAPIPGTSLIGIEIPNEKTSAVYLRGLLANKSVRENTAPLAVPLGKNIAGAPIMCDLAKMPHLLIAGSTGSGKSVCINTILTSILCRATPDEVRLIMIDPKVVELSIYNGIPHLFLPVVTDAKKAAAALAWAVVEMERRYKLFAESSVRDIKGYNEYLKFHGEKPLPLVLIIIDELADLMTVAQKEVEDKISRLAAMARAAGLHLIIATQRPSVDVITGVIKANVPSRIAFAVSSGTDSRTILDSNGAEKLLGKGDMLYAPLSAPKPVRGQGAFVSDKEVEEIVNYFKTRYEANYDQDIIKSIENGAAGGSSASTGSDNSSGGSSDEDDLLEQAVDIVIDAKSASVSILQRRLGIGYPRAARLIDVLEQKRIIGPFEGSKPRRVLITKTDWLEMKAKKDE